MGEVGSLFYNYLKEKYFTSLKNFIVPKNELKALLNSILGLELKEFQDHILQNSFNHSIFSSFVYNMLATMYGYDRLLVTKDMIEEI